MIQISMLIIQQRCHNDHTVSLCAVDREEWRSPAGRRRWCWPACVGAYVSLVRGGCGGEGNRICSKPSVRLLGKPLWGGRWVVRQPTNHSGWRLSGRFSGRSPKKGSKKNKNSPGHENGVTGGLFSVACALVRFIFQNRYLLREEGGSHPTNQPTLLLRTLFHTSNECRSSSREGGLLGHVASALCFVVRGPVKVVSCTGVRKHVCFKIYILVENVNAIEMPKIKIKLRQMMERSKWWQKCDANLESELCEIWLWKSASSRQNRGNVRHPIVCCWKQDLSY